MTVFFDLDRTLMDFENGEDMGIRAVFDEYRSEIKMNYADFRKNWKILAQKAFDEYSAGLYTFDEQRKLRVLRIFEANGVILPPEEVDKRFKLYWSTYEKGVELFSDAKPILENLKQHEIPTGLISNGDGKNQRWKLSKGGIETFFDPVIISGDVGISKPDLRIFQLALEKAGVSKEESWYIGDSIVHDIEPSLKFGMNVIYLNRTLPAGTVNIKTGAGTSAENPVYAEVNSLDSAWEVLKRFIDA